jgi:chaperonin GroEL
MHATKAAVEEGILPGGGVALLRALAALETVTPANDDQKTGVEIVRRALQSPARQIAINAGEDGSVIVGKVAEAKDYSAGWNAQTGEYGDLYKFGIIDPAKVVRVALEDAASVAGLLITTEAMIAEKPKKETAPAWTSKLRLHRKHRDGAVKPAPFSFGPRPPQHSNDAGSGNRLPARPRWF